MEIKSALFSWNVIFFKRNGYKSHSSRLYYNLYLKKSGLFFWKKSVLLEKCKMKRALIYLIPLLFVFLLPLLLRKKAEKIDLSADQLIVVSPHNESIRFEVEQAFRRYYLKKTGRKVCIDWRAAGGTNEIVRYVHSAYMANFRDVWTHDLQKEWNSDVAVAFLNPKLKSDSPFQEARTAFLQSTIGIDVDVFFGGGQYDLNKLAKQGILIPCGLRKRHPELFVGEKPILEQGLGGETWYDPEDRYYTTCFSTFGICANIDCLKHLGWNYDGVHPPITTWKQLGDPSFFGAIGIADPTKSGSITKCFEMVIQREMQDVEADCKKNHPEMSETEILDMGWNRAFTLIKQIGGNSAYLTFSASKVAVDTAQGQVAAGMCIDFYGRSQAEWEENHVGRQTMLFAIPKAASSVSGDPIGILRGAPHLKIAQMFVDFMFSVDAQKLWNYKAGTPGGPLKYTLHRLPVRRDLYTPEHRKYMHAKDAAPFELAEKFIYRGSWTGRYFNLIRNLICVIIINNEDELKLAWESILKAGGPARCPEAMKYFTAMPFTHHEAGAAMGKMMTPESQTLAMREWMFFFRKNYQKATKLAKAKMAVEKETQTEGHPSCD